MFKVLSHSARRKVLWGVVGVLVVLVIIVTIIIIVKRSGKDDPQASSQRIIRKVGELYVLPTGEDPTVAQIKDESKLSNQHFFDTAQNGDYLLVYAKAKVALVYRERLNKLVNAGPINTKQSSIDKSK